MKLFLATILAVQMIFFQAGKNELILLEDLSAEYSAIIFENSQPEKEKLKDAYLPPKVKEVIMPTLVEAEPEVEEEVYEEPEEPDMHLWGECTITHYCNCSQCCGQWAGGPTASGATPTAGWTVACGDLPLGTRVLINGHEYMVEDRGVHGFWIDIYCDSHDEALSRGTYTTDVYILED